MKNNPIYDHVDEFTFNDMIVKGYPYLKTKNIEIISRVLLNLMTSRGIKFDNAFGVMIRVLKNHNDYKRPLITKEVLKELYGEDSKEYLEILQNYKKNFTSCSFEKFSKDYKDKELALIKFKEKYGSTNIRGIMNRKGVDEKTAKLLMKKQTKKSKETFNKRSIEEKIKIGESKSNSLKACKKRWGEEEGTRRYNEISSKRKGQCSLAYYIKKFGEKEGMIKYKEKKGPQHSHWCKEFWILKGYSEKEAIEKIKHIFDKREDFSLVYCIKKYGKEKGKKVFDQRQKVWQKTLNSKPKEIKDEMNRRKGVTLQNYIDKYGKIEGESKYIKWCESFSKRKGFSSKEASSFFLKLYKNIRKLGLVGKKEALFSCKGSKEYFIRDKNSVRFYDFCIPRLKIIIEYNGVEFHARENDFGWKNYLGVSYEEITKLDKNKLILAEKKGYNVYYVWSDEDLEEKMNEMISIILERTE